MPAVATGPGTRHKRKAPALNSTGAYYFSMNTNKILDTLLTGSVGIIGVNLVEMIREVANVKDVYLMFTQSLIATAAIGRLFYDIISAKNKKNEK